jgi:hypothetical protein
MFIHVHPEETQTLQRIPRALLFPAPGLPPGHLLMGYNDEGHCPMLIDNQCSIYDHRPRTCRDYDCRVFAAAGIPVDPQSQPEIAQRVDEWAFTYETETSRDEHAAVQRAAAFLQQKRDLFPPDALPTNPGRLAALAVRFHHHFAGPAPARPDAAIVAAIVTESMPRPRRPRRRKR